MAGNNNPNQQAEFSRTYNSFSGVDIHAVFGGSSILEIQGISFTVSREKAPIYTMGNANPRAFCRGKRGIAGTVIFTVFDRQALLESQRDRMFWADAEELTARSQALSAGTTSTQRAGLASPDNPLDPGSDRFGLGEAAVPWYEDQITPFNIVLVAMNEYGHQMKMEIRGCEILNQGQGISVDDLMIDQQMTFIATDIFPWIAGAFTPASIKDTMHPTIARPQGAAFSGGSLL